jgi:hypothetical protein
MAVPASEIVRSAFQIGDAASAFGLALGDLPVGHDAGASALTAGSAADL